MSRRWIKGIPAKMAHAMFGHMLGAWSKEMDRYWESDDGYAVASRQIRTGWGVVEHVTIQRMNGSGDVPWAVKQAIKDELFGDRRIAIEVFPSKKHLVDVCDVYHLWVLPKDFVMPFGIHPLRDPQCEVIERGYDFDPQTLTEWTESAERKALVGDESLSELLLALAEPKADVLGVSE